MSRAWLALSAVLWLAAFVSSCHAQLFHESQAVFLSDCQKAWGTSAISGWSQGANCSAAEGLFCDQSGMILEMSMEESGLAGPIPDSISRLTRISFLNLYNNHLNGSIPAGIGSLIQLGYLRLGKNRLTGSIPAGISSFTSLASVGFEDNQLSGLIPGEIGNLLSLEALNLSNNSLIGSVPNSISLLIGLTHLDLSKNLLTGSIPNSILFLTGLSYLFVGQNQFTGTIPAGIGNLDQLEMLDLSSSSLSGSIPDKITSLTWVSFLNLSGNRLNGSIPSALANRRELNYLYLSNNMLIGSIPEFAVGSAALIHMVLSGNQLSGPIPTSIYHCTNLQRLWLDNNSLSGALPNSFGVLSKLTSFIITGTNLTCPPDYTACGPTQSPKTVFCRTCPSFCSTCGKRAPEPTPNTSSSSTSSSESSAAAGGGGVSVGAIIGIAVAAVVILLLLVAALVYFRLRMQRKPKTGLAGSLAASHCTEFSLAEVLKATNNWSEDNQLGSGAFGDVYKGVSPRDGTTVWAVKRAKLIDVDFQREIQQMADKNHPNIVRLLGFAIGGDLRTRPEQVLIYEYVPNGDLQKWTGPDAASPLNLKQRLDVLIGLARGFEYLHSFGMVHRDIKPANVLITADMQPKIADFGLVRAGEGTTVGTTRIMGTRGYVDPVYSRTSKATAASDVYSFGVLMLVVLTGQAPLTESAGGTRKITLWASECVSSGDMRSLRDPKMDAPGEAELRLAELAISCTVELTASRPSMAHIANELQAIREEVVGKDELSAAVKVDAQVQQMKNAEIEVTSQAHLLLDTCH
ncbi:hypothetical protein CLOP_g17879 [Closterium sp. NIES-67]|nr:hypothetical protein CLOP_g17879 [Closterium sp. NIES-67]